MLFGGHFYHLYICCFGDKIKFLFFTLILYTCIAQAVKKAFFTIVLVDL